MNIEYWIVNSLLCVLSLSVITNYSMLRIIKDKDKIIEKLCGIILNKYE